MTALALSPRVLALLAQLAEAQAEQTVAFDQMRKALAGAEA